MCVCVCVYVCIQMCYIERLQEGGGGKVFLFVPVSKGEYRRRKRRFGHQVKNSIRGLT